MELNFLRDNRFNNLSHKSFFLDYMFVTNKSQLEKHESHDFFAYINRKVHIYHEETDIDKRKQAVSILKRKEIDLENGVQKSFIIYLEKIDVDREALFRVLTNLCTDYIQKEADKSGNIDFVYAVSHIDQKEQCPHLHVFYQCKEDIDNELPFAVCKKLMGH